MKTLISLLMLFLISTVFTGCDELALFVGTESESEVQDYYAPTANEIKNKIFTEKGTNWEVSFFNYYSTGTDEHRWQLSNKGSGYIYSFYSDFTYEYRTWKNDYEYLWVPYTTKSYSGKVDIYDGKMVFYDLFGEEKLEKSIQLSENNRWIKIGNSAYKLK